MARPSAAIRLEEVSKSFGKKRVLDRVSFEVTSGNAFCVLGPSGTGKSVTLKLIIGLLKPDSGKISVDGEEITELDSRELAPIRKKMGFLFQNSALFDSISVGENVAFPLRRHSKMKDAEIRGLVEKKLEEVGLKGEYHTAPSELSGGMRKRASLARAMALDPAILLVDEPSAGLDPITSLEIDELLIETKEEKDATLIVVTHNIPSARRIGDELLMLKDGAIAARGTAEELEQSDDDMVRKFMTAQQGG